MTSNEMSESVAKFFEEANTIQWKKNADYHPDKVAFLEIMRTASECNISVEQDLWAKIRKQYIALRSFAIDGRVESESPRSRMIDIAVYMGMFAFWEENKRQILKDALIFVLMKTNCESDRVGNCTGHETVVSICDRCRFKFWLEDHAPKN